MRTFSVRTSLSAGWLLSAISWMIWFLWFSSSVMDSFSSAARLNSWAVIQSSRVCLASKIRTFTSANYGEVHTSGREESYFLAKIHSRGFLLTQWTAPLLTTTTTAEAQGQVTTLYRFPSYMNELITKNDSKFKLPANWSWRGEEKQNRSRMRECLLCIFYYAIKIWKTDDVTVIITFVALNLFELIYQNGLTLTHLDLLPTAHVLIQRLTGLCYGLSQIWDDFCHLCNTKPWHSDIRLGDNDTGTILWHLKRSSVASKKGNLLLMWRVKRLDLNWEKKCRTSYI